MNLLRLECSVTSYGPILWIRKMVEFMMDSRWMRQEGVPTTTVTKPVRISWPRTTSLLLSELMRLRLKDTKSTTGIMKDSHRSLLFSQLRITVMCTTTKQLLSTSLRTIWKSNNFTRLLIHTYSQIMLICSPGLSHSLQKNVNPSSNLFLFSNYNLVIDIFVNLLQSTDDIGNEELTPQEEIEVQ